VEITSIPHASLSTGTVEDNSNRTMVRLNVGRKYEVVKK
jgi:hypothetical protein